MFGSSRHKYRVLYVLHVIFGYRSSCMFVPTINTMFDTLSMIINVYVCVFQSNIPRPYCLVYYMYMIFLLHIFVFQSSIVCPDFSTYQWSSLFMFVFSRYKGRVHNVRHIIYDHCSSCLCVPEINTLSLMLDISTMIVVVYVCDLQSPIPNLIVRYIIHDHPSLCLCLPELNIISRLYDMCSVIIFVHVCVFQRHISCP